MERLKRLFDVVEVRGAVCDQSVRVLAQVIRLEEIEAERRDEKYMERSNRALGKGFVILRVLLDLTQVCKI